MSLKGVFLAMTSGSDGGATVHSSVHPVLAQAFHERTRTARANFLAWCLGQQDVFDARVSARCEQYVEKFAADQRQFVRLYGTEATVEGDLALGSGGAGGGGWIYDTWQSKVNMLLHRPLATRAGVVFATISTVICIGAAIKELMESDVDFNPGLNPKNHLPFLLSEVFFTIYFTLETVLRLAVHSAPLVHVTTAGFAVEILSVMPLYVIAFLGTFIADIEVYIVPFRMFRLLRLGHVGVQFQPAKIMILTLQKSVTSMGAPLAFLLLAAVMTGGVMYILQSGTLDPVTGEFTIGDCDCDARFNASGCTSNLPTPFGEGMASAIWWSIVTMLTVGFGDVAPTCVTGRVWAAVTILIAAFIMAMPISVLSNEFTQNFEATKTRRLGRKLDHARLLAEDHQRLLQIAAAGKVRDILPGRFRILCMRYGVPAALTDEAKVRTLEAVLLAGTQPLSHSRRNSHLDSDGKEIETVVEVKNGGSASPARSDNGHPSTSADPKLPLVVTLSEALFEYLQQRCPFEFVDLANPSEDVILLIDTFIERIFRRFSGEDGSDLAQRFDVSPPSDPAAMRAAAMAGVPSVTPLRSIIPLVAHSEQVVGIDVPPFPSPDVSLPVSDLGIGDRQVSLGPRMAVLRTQRTCGERRFLLRGIEPFRPFVNGVEVVPATTPYLEERPTKTTGRGAPSDSSRDVFSSASAISSGQRSGGGGGSPAGGGGGASFVGPPAGVKLIDRDEVNFGTPEEPICYMLVTRDEFTDVCRGVALDEALPLRLWASGASDPAEIPASAPLLHPASYAQVRKTPPPPFESEERQPSRLLGKSVVPGTRLEALGVKYGVLSTPPPPEERHRHPDRTETLTFRDMQQRRVGSRLVNVPPPGRIGLSPSPTRRAFTGTTSATFSL